MNDEPDPRSSAPDPNSTDAVLEALGEELAVSVENLRRVLVLNGVNLGRLGVREPNVYGNITHDQLAAKLRAVGLTLRLNVVVRQTDDEAEMIGWLHEAADDGIPVVLNGAAWTHYSIALRDAAAQRTADLVELHLSNIHAREEFRHRSVISAVASGVIAGLGPLGYELALRFIAARVGD